MGQSMQCMYTVAALQYRNGTRKMNPGPQAGKCVRSLPPSIWHQVFVGEISGFASSSPIDRLKFDPVFPTCKLIGGPRSAKPYYIPWWVVTFEQKCAIPTMTPMTHVSAVMRTVTFCL
jgi:hypothetical protein